MLLLTHHGREIIILETSDGPIELRLSRLDGAQTRIGIDAPRAVRIIRKEPQGSGDPAVTPVVSEQDDAPWWHHPDDIEAQALAEARAANWEEEMFDGEGTEFHLLPR